MLNINYLFVETIGGFQDDYGSNWIAFWQISSFRNA